MIHLENHQNKAVDKALPIILQKRLVYVYGPPRIGKSLISLELIERCKPRLLKKGKTIVFTKKNAILGWQKFQNTYEFEVTNYEQVEKLNSKDYNFVIVDESHNFGAFPKPSQRTVKLRNFCQGKPIIFLSGTPMVETPLSMYSQLSLSSWSPFNHFKNGYDFFRTYGISELAWIGGGRQIETYKNCKKDEILSQIKDIFITVSYEDAGFNYQNYDKIIPLEDNYIESITQSTLIQKDNSDFENPQAERQYLHRICGGFYNGAVSTTKIYWLSKFVEKHEGEKIAIMAYFVEEQQSLEKLFKNNANVDIYSSTRYCEGIDLSGYDRYILYSFGYSGAKFIQLRDRIVNIFKNKKTEVIIPLICNSLDEVIYNCVNQKTDFNNKVYRKIKGELRYKDYK